MRCTPIVAGLVLSSIIFAPASAQAQVSIDVSKISCDQYVHNKIPTCVCRKPRPFDLVKESRNVGHDGRAALLPFEAIGFAVQVDQPA